MSDSFVYESVQSALGLTRAMGMHRASDKSQMISSELLQASKSEIEGQDDVHGIIGQKLENKYIIRCIRF